jgi:hypothetical protein
MSVSFPPLSYIPSTYISCVHCIVISISLLLPSHLLLHSSFILFLSCLYILPCSSHSLHLSVIPPLSRRNISSAPFLPLFIPFLPCFLPSLPPYSFPSFYFYGLSSLPVS